MQTLAAPPDARARRTALSSDDFSSPPNDGKLYQDTSTLPNDWTVQFDSKSDAYAKVDTVACVEVASEQMVKECTGYTLDDQTKTYDAPPSTDDLIALVKPFVQP